MKDLKKSLSCVFIMANMDLPWKERDKVFVTFEDRPCVIGSNTPIHGVQCHFTQ